MTTTKPADQPEADPKKDLKPVKTKMRVRKSDVRQCRLCLRVLSREDVRETCTPGLDIRRKILDAVAVKITAEDKVKLVCINCLLVVDIIYNFRAACRKADTIHGTRLLMMHPGSWLSDTNKETLEACHQLMKRNRAEMDALFKCSGLESGEIHQLKKKEVLLELEQEPSKQADEVSDSDPEMSKQCGKKLDQQVTDVKLETRQEESKQVFNKDANSKMHMCEICGNLVEKSMVELHINRHLNKRPYKCSVDNCSMRFYSPKRKREHIRARHSDLSKLILECKKCHKKMKAAQMKRHLKTHEESETNPYKSACSICGKMYYKYVGLRYRH